MMATLIVSDKIAERLKQITERENRHMDDVLEYALTYYDYYTSEIQANVEPIDQSFSMPVPQEYTLHIYRCSNSHSHIQIQAWQQATHTAFYLILFGLEYISAPSAWLGPTIYIAPENERDSLIREQDLKLNLNKVDVTQLKEARASDAPNTSVRLDE
jgi:hypothetical protein